MRKEKGITLVSLILTVVVLIIIVSVSISFGTSALDSTRLKGFYMQLEIVQERVDDVASTNESYIDETGKTVDITKAGEDLEPEQEIFLQTILSDEKIPYVDIIDRFRYFTIQDIKSILDLEEIDYNLFINFEDRIIVAEDGITIDGTPYYMLENTKYFVEPDTSKNIGTIESLQYNIHKYGSDKYKITVTPSNIIGDLDGIGYLKYKKTTTKYWETSNSLEIIVELDIEYNIIYMDSNKNSIEKTIKAEFEKDEDGNLLQDEEGNNILTVREINDEQESGEI